jgi:hypothetical protein
MGHRDHATIAAGAKGKHDRVITVSDLNDRWPTDDADVIAIKQATALVPAVDLTRVAANIMRVADRVDADRGVGGVATNVAAPPSSGSQALALMLMFDLDRETL